MWGLAAAVGSEGWWAVLAKCSAPGWRLVVCSWVGALGAVGCRDLCIVDVEDWV
jgi:hypothetical protein